MRFTARAGERHQITAKAMSSARGRRHTRASSGERRYEYTADRSHMLMLPTSLPVENPWDHMLDAEHNRSRDQSMFGCAQLREDLPPRTSSG